MSPRPETHEEDGAVAWRIEDDRIQRIGEFDEHRSPVASVAISEDGTRAASGDTRGNVFLWRTEHVQPTDFESSIRKAITKMEKGESRQRLVSAKSKSTSAQSWKAHPDAVEVLRFDQSGRYLLSGSDDYTIRIWQTGDQSLVNTLRGHGGWVRALDFAGFADEGDLRRVLSGSVDGSLRIWEPTRRTADALVSAVAGTSKQVARDKQAHSDEILAARLDSEGSRVITASRDHTARILEINRKTLSFRQLAEIKAGVESGRLAEGSEFLAMSAAVDSAGKRLFVGSADATIRIWDLKTGTQLGELPGTGLNKAFALSGDGRRLLSGSSDPDARAILWDVDRRRADARVLHRFVGHQQAVSAFALSSDGTIMVTGDRGGRCIVWDGVNFRPIEEPIDGLRGFRINDLAFAADDQSIWIASDSGQLAEFALRSRRRIRSLEHDGFVNSLSLSPNGLQAVTVSQLVSDDRFVSTATLWNLRTGQGQSIERVESRSPKGDASSYEADRITSARFGLRGKHIVVCRRNASGRSGRVSILRSSDADGVEFQTPESIGAPESGIFLDADQLLTLNGEAAFRWNVKEMVHEKSYRPHASVAAACFSSDGRIAATASRSVRLWNPETGQSIDKLENPHLGGVSSLDFLSVNAGEYLIATCGADATAKLWTWAGPEKSFQLRQEFAINGTNVTQARFTNDGKRLLIAGQNGALQLMPLTNDRQAIVDRRVPNGASITCVAFSSNDRWPRGRRG